MKSAAFQHLLKHYRATKSQLACSIATLKAKRSDVVKPKEAVYVAELRVAKDVGAMNCLYWQALGLEELNLAKGIRRTISRAEKAL